MEKQSTYSFHLVLLSEEDALCDLWLPAAPEGFLRFSDKPEHRFLGIAAQDGHWTAICRKPAFFRNVPIENSFEMQIEDGLLLKIEFEDRQYMLYAEKATNEQLKFKNYFISSDAVLSIGSQATCDICYSNPHVAPKHAVLHRTDGRWWLQDCSNTVGLYVNGKKKQNVELNSGDSIYLLGLRILIGPGYLSVNSEMAQVELGQQLQPYMIQQGGYSYHYGHDLLAVRDIHFNRSPRKQIKWEPGTITVEGPPMSMSNSQIPLMLRMGSSMVMGGSAALAGNFITLITAVLFPFLSSKYTDKQRQEYEQLRVSKYTEYLNKKHLEILDACKEELAALNKKYPALSEVVDIAKEKHRLWERRPIDDDFLHMRIGTGTQPMHTVIDYPPRGFELESDSLEDKMYQLVEKPYHLQNAPIILSLTDTTVCGILGPRERIIDYLRKFVLQMAVLHSYDEVKMVFLLDESELAQMDCLRYLPHVWDDQRSVRYIATTEAEAYALGEHIKKQIEVQQDRPENLRDILKKRPYYVVFALDKKLLESHEVMKEILQSDSNLGVSIVAAYEDLPKETQRILSLVSDYGNVCTALGANGSEETGFSLDACDGKEIDKTMRILANTSLKSVTQAQSLPKMVTFLEMFKAGRIEQLNPLKRWHENNPVKSLAAPVGVGEDGSVFMLDLHEKRQGPHGLVAGMTGSGKSEFLITYILSMAVNYHPDEVAFVLIDYKGGGLADAFENPRTGMRLPHLAGTITNLDGASIQRSLMSIESELVRRQKVFSEVSKSFEEGSMNIYTYQKLYRAGKVSEPMPHLFIISDEFAELKQQQPEFMEKLISAARIGRSLGVHLILATQKPSGVVNDQIRSNTKFRVCLRVQERADSQDMLKRPEAAELTDTGRFYLQVGYNEYFALGQSAWCGAPYEPQDSAPVQRDDAVEFLDITGQVTATAKPKAKKSDSGMSQIVAVVQHLSSLADKQGISVRRLWIDPLKTVLDYNDVPVCDEEDVSDKVTAVLGMIDDPQKQSQYPFLAKLQEYQSLLIVGNGGSGKTTLVKTMLYSLAMRYTPDKVNFYIMDFSGGALNVFRHLPQCGACLTENDEAAVDRLMQMLRDLIKERKQLFNQAGVSNYEAYKTIEDIPLVVVVIDNAFGLTSLQKGNAYFNVLHEYLKDSAALGIKFVITCSNLNEVSTRARQEISTRIAMQLKDKYAYGDVLGIRSGAVPQPNCGRGMCAHEGKMLEFQTAMPFSQSNEIEQNNLLADMFKQIAERDKNFKPAKRLPIINSEETYEEFCSTIPMGRIPLGYDLQNIKQVSIPFAQLFSAAIYFGQERAAGPVFDNLAFAAEKNGMDLIFVKRSKKSALDGTTSVPIGASWLRVFENGKKASLELCYLLIDEVKQRKAYRNEYCEANHIPAEQAKQPENVKKAASYIREHTKPLMVIFEDFLEFSQNLEDGCFAVYQDIFNNGKGYNLYFFGAFYPYSTQASNDLLTKTFANTALLMLFGGQLQKQPLAILPMEVRKAGVPEMEYNHFLMRYNDAFYPMVMPCTAPCQEQLDPDERPII